MKKYNLSQIITAAWNYVKYLKVSLSEGLKKAWIDAKIIRKPATIKCGDMFTVDAVTGIVSAKPYKSREFKKKNLMQKWNGSFWTIDIEKFNKELNKYPGYYHKTYIISEERTENVEKVVDDKQLVNHADGFYCQTYYKDGSYSVALIG